MLKWIPGRNNSSSNNNRSGRGENSGLNRDELPMASDDHSPAALPGVIKTYRTLDDIEQAEDSVLSNVEAQGRRTSKGADGFRPAVPGERVPLGVENLGTALGYHDDDDDDDDDDGFDDDDLGGVDSPAPPPPRASPGVSRPSFKQMAMRVQTINRLKMPSSRRLSSSNNKASSSTSGDRSVTSSITKTSTGSNGEISSGHRRAKTLLASIDEAPKEADEKQEGHEPFTDFSKDLFAAADLTPNEEHEGLNYLLNEDSFDDEDQLDQDLEDLMNLPSVVTGPAESQPLLGADGGIRPGGGGDDPIDIHATIIMERRRLVQQRKNERRWKRIKNFLNPIKVMQRLASAFLDGTFIFSITMFVVAWILFYYVGNPQLDFLPGSATISWWLNFVGRQLLLFELAKLTQYLLIDVMTMSSKVVVQMLGPWVTIFCLQSRGWPFLVAFWGVYDMLLLHGDNHFQNHWLYWTEIRIYSQANSGSYILASSVYFRVLIGMVLAGVATTLKRTVLTLYFGKRSFDVYKPKLEEILNDIIVLTELAELGAEADNLPDTEDSEQLDTKQLIEMNLKKRPQLSEARWSSVRFKQTANRSDSDMSPIVLDNRTGDDGGGGIGGVEDSPMPERSDTKDGDYNGKKGARWMRQSTTSSGLFRIKNLLDRWEEPVNKLDKANESSVNDILKFRKALTYMDLENPFGEAFGRASNRDELINSAQELYYRLLRLSPGSFSLPFSVLSVLVENDDGTIDRNLKRSIETIFRADRDGEIPFLAFVQSCDVVYRKLRYFRASVGNASVIDKVLESILNGLYAFGLTVVIMSLLNFNPWPLLVSISTLLVSFAFAIGPTAAKAIEGILLIVGTRPFDIGDRIIIANQAGQSTAGVADSWFVEDITLFSTTLRLGANNELATISNGAIASTRITNCQRSKNAVVNILLKLHISMHDGDKVDKFKEELENYISDNPTVWDALIFLRCEDINSDDEYVMYRLGTRSRLSWQLAARILADRGRLHQFCTELAKKMQVNFDSPASRKVLYYGGNLVDGAIKDFKKNLLMDRNNISRGDMGMFDSRRDLGRTAPRESSSTGPLTGAPQIDPGLSTGLPPIDPEAETPTSSAADDLFLSMVQQSHE